VCVWLWLCVLFWALLRVLRAREQGKRLVQSVCVVSLLYVYCLFVVCESIKREESGNSF